MTKRSVLELAESTEIVHCPESNFTALTFVGQGQRVTVGILDDHIEQLLGALNMHLKDIQSAGPKFN